VANDIRITIKGRDSNDQLLLKRNPTGLWHNIGIYGKGKYRWMSLKRKGEEILTMFFSYSDRTIKQDREVS
tara:strand:- start:616 stop:828 length:213 start_codon:yes stop_codon:yes gene_type:complete